MFKPSSKKAHVGLTRHIWTDTPGINGIFALVSDGYFAFYTAGSRMPVQLIKKIRYDSK